MNLEDPTRIMTCRLNKRLQGQKAALAKGVPIARSLSPKTKMPGML